MNINKTFHDPHMGNRVYLFLQDIFCTYDDYAIIMLGDNNIRNAFSKNTVEQLKLFIPQNLFEDIKESDFNDISMRSLRNYRIFTKLKREIKKSDNNYSTIVNITENIKSHLEYSLKNFIVDKNALLNYFIEIKGYILGTTEGNSSNKEVAFASELYDIYIENQEIIKLLTMIFLSCALVQCPVVSENKVLYLTGKDSTQISNAKAILQEIWLDKEAVIARLKQYKDAPAESVLVDNIYSSAPKSLRNDVDFDYTYMLNQINRKKCSYYEKIFNQLLTAKNHSDSVYLLSEFYKGTYDFNDSFTKFNVKNRTKFEETWQRALELGNVKAILSEVKELSKKFNKNYKRIYELLNNINADMNNEQKALYYYYKANCLEKLNKHKDAQEDFKFSLALGYEKSRQNLDKERRFFLEERQSFRIDKPEKICIVNAINNDTLNLIKTLPKEYIVYSIGCNFDKTKFDGIEYFYNAEECVNFILKNIAQNSPKGILFALFSDDYNDNLQNCLEIQDRLYNATFDISDEKRKRQIISLFNIFVKCNYEYASTFIDANLSDMGDNVYFKTQIIDPYYNAIINLIYNKPLFIPCLGNNKKVNAALCSNNNAFSLEFIKQTMAIGYFGESYRTNLNVYCDKYDDLKNDISLNIHGLSNAQSPTGKELKGIIKPLINGNNDVSYNESEIITSLKNSEANYIVVNIGTDIENIAFATKIRRELLTSSDKLNKKPFIAIYCRNPHNAYLASRMTLENKNQNTHWHNNYDFYFFGTSESLYSYDSLINNSLSKQALAVHLSYNDFDFDSIFDQIDYEDDNLFNCLNSFYSYQYNQDSSLITAISLRYRLFIAGCYKNRLLNEPFSIMDDIKDNNIALYVNMLKGNRETYSETEQIRWNNQMLSRGWKAPTLNQLSLYIKDPTITNHKYNLAKLHPYIANWDDLDDDDPVCKIIIDSDKDYESPKEITRKSIDDTCKWLSILKKKELENELNTER